MHQDGYGEVAFQLQVAVALSAVGSDYTGGELVLTEKRPRRQSGAEVVSPKRGEVLVFCNRYRPVRKTRGYYRVNVRHGVRRVRSGRRVTLGGYFTMQTEPSRKPRAKARLESLPLLDTVENAGRNGRATPRRALVDWVTACGD